MSDNSDNEVEELSSAAQVAQRFQEWWISERNCPVLLPYQGELVDCLLDQLDHMRQGLSQLKANDLRAGLHRLEVERIQYLINDYLRCRLKKIQKFLPQRPSPEINELLSDQERTFIDDVVNATHKHFQASALSQMPAGMQQLSLPERAEERDHYVFCRVKKAAPGVMVDPDSIVDFEIGSQHIVKLDPIRNYVHSSSFILL